jgi:hypothetical protein
LQVYLLIEIGKQSLAKRQTGILPLVRGGGGGDDHVAGNSEDAAKIIPS